MNEKNLSNSFITGKLIQGITLKLVNIMKDLAYEEQQDLMKECRLNYIFEWKKRQSI